MRSAHGKTALQVAVERACSVTTETAHMIPKFLDLIRWLQVQMEQPNRIQNHKGNHSTKSDTLKSLKSDTLKSVKSIRFRANESQNDDEAQSVNPSLSIRKGRVRVGVMVRVTTVIL